jgi:putative sigma-54 modulation protein
MPSQSTPLMMNRCRNLKTHEMAPMSVEEASSRMELLGHSFFVFQNAADSTISVIYRRHDGDYGLIVPEAVGQ